MAVKTLHMVTEASVMSFRMEILLHAALRHPNICNFVGGAWGRELTGLVLEWVSKGTCSELLAREPDLAWEDPLLKIATDVARGMAYLHAREVRRLFGDQLTALLQS